MDNISDTAIIESVRKGNHSDYALLIERYKNKAFSLLKRMLKDNMEAEEILQDCFLKAFNGLNNFKQESKFSTWFYRIVYNTALTRLSSKKRKIEKEMSSIDLHYDLKSSYDFNTPELKDLSVFLKDLIEQLPPNYASVVNMFYLDEMSCEEISQVTGSSISNVKVLLFRSREALRKILSKNKLSEEIN